MTPSIWCAFLINWLFWSGAAIGAVVFAALLDLTGAEWSGRIRTLAQRYHRFLAISLVAYVALVVREPRVYGRGLAALVVVYAAVLWFCHASAGRTRAIVVLLIAYIAGFSVVANDVILSLDPDWISTLFPAYVFMTNVYGGIATVSAFVLVLDVAGQLTIDERQRRDLGMVLVGFALLWMYFVWSQYLVIWYGNLPDETAYIIRRMTGGWQPIVWTVIALRFVLPVAILITRTGRYRIPFMLVAFASVAGFWMEYLLMVGPATNGLTASTAVPLTMTFALAFLLSTVQFRGYSDSSPLR